MSNTISCGCGGVPTGRETINAMEYLNDDLYSFVLASGFCETREDEKIDFLLFDIGRDVRGNERE